MRPVPSWAAGIDRAAGSPLDFGDGLEVVGELGRGAYAAVYRVRRDGVDYALKALHHQPDDVAGRSLLEFRREAALLALLDHPGVPKVFDVGRADGRPYLVMELLDGGSLVDLLERGTMAEEALVRVGLEVAGALAAAHRVGLVHRDIKPDNIVVGSDGAARLVDFGLAARGQIDHDEDSAAAGTFEYCAPEQAGMLRRAVDGRADLYSLGVVLFECATGVAPFASDDVGELIRLHATAPAPDPRGLRPELSNECAGVISRLLAKDPDDRYQSANDLLVALERLIPGSAVGMDRGSRGAVSSLVGRERERADLVGQWERARAGDGGVVLIEGVAGSGKSVLARELTAAALLDGALVLAGKCDSDQPIPLAALREAVDRYVRSVSDLPDAERATATDALRAAAGTGASLLRPLSSGLAALLDARELSAEDRGEQFFTAVAQFLAELARSAGAMVVHIDDVQWADPATRRVLRRLVADLADTPLLVLTTARNGIEYADAVAGFTTDAGERLRLRVALGPLADEGVARLVSAQLAGSKVSVDLVGQLAVRGGGNPFTTLEYLHALIDAGALYPSRGTWQLDADLLDALELPSDVLDLVLARIDGLGPQHRGVLAVAAAVGSRFRVDLVAEAAGADPLEVHAAVRAAIDHRLVEAAGETEFAFVHDRVREALLRGASDDELRRTHQRVAEVLDRAASEDPRRVYAVAAHYAAGETETTPERVFHTGWAAGRLALDENTLAAAVSFLEPAAAAARSAGTEPDSLFLETLAQAYLRTGRVDAAKRELRGALASERDPLRRAALLLAMGLAQRIDWDVAASIESCREGLAVIGHPMPRNPLALLGSTLWSLLLTVVAGKLRLNRLRTWNTRGEKRERNRLWAALNIAAAHTAGVGIIHPILPFFSARARWPASRLGPSPEYVDSQIGLAMGLSRFRMHRRADRVFARAQAVAVGELGDAKLGAGVVTMAGLGKMVGGIDNGETLYRVAEEQRRWLDTGLYLNATAQRCFNLVGRGYPREALTRYEHGITSVVAAELPAGHAHGTVVAMARALLGDANGAAALVAEQRHNGPDDPARLVSVMLAAVQCVYEQGELGEPFDAAVRDFTALGVRVSQLYSDHRMFYVYQALGRLAQGQRAATQSSEELPGRLAAAEQAVRELRRAVNADLLRAYHTVARASLLQLRGDNDKAWAVLAHAEPGIYRLDAPAVGYETARIRARVLRALGIETEAQRQAQAALALAGQHGWGYRARWVRAEFGVTEASVRGSTPHTRQSATSSGDRNQRRIQALQEVSRAATSVLDPQQLARVALDEAVRILGAERALLFLADGDSAVRPALGRDSTGRDIQELTGFSSTLVDRVAGSREALVVTGSEEGAALGSRSAVVHGLRSIMVAPLETDGRLLGVVYLDSRVAKGIFTDDDIDILSAMTHPIAAGLETARAAQLDAAVQVAHQQRDVAETLRQTMAELSATLDPDEVRRLLLAIVSRAAAADRACLVLHDGDTVTLTTPDTSGPIDSREVDVEAMTANPEVASGTVVDVPPPAVALLGPVRCWATAPITTRGHGSGVLLVGSTTREALTEAQVEIVAAIAGQGASAYDNALLFRQVQLLATTDVLTGINNRRQFTDLARRQLSIAQRNNRPTVAIMLDIDHFKKVNDTYGHGTGDEVIKTVAAVVAKSLRDHDIFGRLGGEEFAVVTPEMNGDPIVVAERLRTAVEAASSAGVAGPVSVTVSVGVAELKPDDTLDTLLARADDALYRAKQGGRNRVQIA